MTKFAFQNQTISNFFESNQKERFEFDAISTLMNFP